MMKQIHKPYLFFLLWHVMMVGGVHISTIQHEPGRGVSGNGNLGLLVLFPSILTFIILCIWTMTLTRRWLNDHRDRSGWMYALIPIVAIFVLWSVCLYGSSIHSQFRRTAKRLHE